MIITCLFQKTKCYCYALKYDNWSQFISGLTFEKTQCHNVQKQGWEIGC